MKSVITRVVASDTEKFAQLVRFHRQAFGLAQQRSTNMAGVTRPAITRLESRAPSVRLDTALKVLDALGVEGLTYYTSEGADSNVQETRRIPIWTQDGQV